VKHIPELNFTSEELNGLIGALEKLPTLWGRKLRIHF